MSALIRAKTQPAAIERVTNSLIKLDSDVDDGAPTNKDVFAEGRTKDGIMVRIQNFFESNKVKAFTEEQIIGHIYPDHIAWPGETFAFGSAMLILAYAGKIGS